MFFRKKELVADYCVCDLPILNAENSVKPSYGEVFINFSAAGTYTVTRE
jgi:hypothetical protein